jgi:NAD(P)-dependent dehydrogenase (short-subunit alcohol dehydrogenase family)
MTWNIKGRTVLVTGGNSGLGLATAVGLAQAGANVTITSRDQVKGDVAASEIGQRSGSVVEVMCLDLADLASVKSFADEFMSRHDDLGVLVNNAGGVFGSRRETVDGFEMTIGTNHIGPFVLTNLLTDLLISSAPSRIINVGSSAHGYAKEGIAFDDLNWEQRRYNQKNAYGQSKLANILHARELNRRLSPQGVTAYAVHPGVVRTGFGTGGDSAIVGVGIRIIGRWLLTPDQGAETSIWAATNPYVVEHAGGYFADSAPAKSSRHARDDDQALRLWEATEELVDRHER